MNQTNTYALATGQKASEILDKQNDLLSANTYEHLEKAGLSKGHTVCDIGCGNGAMTVYLAQKIGDTGHVYAIDISEEQLAVAKEKISAAGLNNVTFIKADVRSQEDLPIGLADIVYMRYVLMHVKDPGLVIDIAKTLLKPSGVMVSQESIMSAAYSVPENEVFREYVTTIMALGKTLGVDYDVGNRLELLYKQAGYTHIEAYHTSVELNLQLTKEFLPPRLAEWKDKAINAGITTTDKVEKLDSAIRNFPDDKNFCFKSPQAHVLAWKAAQ